MGSADIARYTGNEAVYTHTFEHEKKPNCPVCGSQATRRQVDPRWSLHEFIESLKEDPNTYAHPLLSLTIVVRLKNPRCVLPHDPFTCSRLLSLKR